MWPGWKWGPSPGTDLERVRLAQAATTTAEGKGLVGESPAGRPGPGGHHAPALRDRSHGSRGSSGRDPCGAAPAPVSANGAPWGLSVQSLCAPAWGRAGPPPPPRPLMASPPVSAATLKSKQDELHRKALQTLER